MPDTPVTPSSPSQPQAPPLAIEEERGAGGVGGSQQSGNVTDEQTTVTAGSSAGALPFTGAESLLLTLLLGLTALGLGAGLRKAVQSRP